MRFGIPPLLASSIRNAVPVICNNGLTTSYSRRAGFSPPPPPPAKFGMSGAPTIEGDGWATRWALAEIWMRLRAADVGQNAQKAVCPETLT